MIQKKTFPEWIEQVSSAYSKTVSSCRDFVSRHRILTGIVVAAVLLLLPVVFTTNYTRGIFVKICLYVILSSSLNVINGYSGQMNIGHAGLVCIGAYTAGLLCTNFDLSFWLILPISGIMSAIVGFLISRPVMKLDGVYLAIVTMGCSEIIRLIVLNWTSFTGGPMGIRGIPRPTIFSYEIRTPLEYYYLALFLAALTVFAIYRVVHSRVGRTWISIREDHIASRFLGVKVSYYRSLNFVFGAFFAGIGGCFLTYYYQYISSDMFITDESFNIMSMVIIGGQGTLLGPIVGSIIVNVITEAFRFVAEYRFIVYALLIIGMMWLRPQGLVGASNSVFAVKRVRSRKKITRKEATTP